jgi:heparin binding hemagglutinin HbhA
MPTMPKAEDVNKAREQAAQAIGGAAEQARTPLMAALGAGDIATQAVRDTLNTVRSQLNERAESAKAGVNDLPSDLGELRDRLDPAELRKLVDTYTQSAVKIYKSLADRGEDTFGRLRSQPQVQRAWSQVETAQDRVGDAVGDVRGLADDVLGRVSRTTRSVGEKAARAAEKTAADTAETVKKTGDEAAQAVKDTGARAATATRSTARKTASQTSRATSAKGTEAGKQAKSSTSKSSES